MNRLRLFSALLGVVVTFGPSEAASNAANSKSPNILWLIGEDLSPDLGCYGTEQVWTPNLDRLAAQGVRYTRAFTTAPVCSASRSAFMTGMYQTTIGAHNHRSHRDDDYRVPEGVKVLTDWLRPAGYFTANLREMPEHFGYKGSGKTDWNFTYVGNTPGSKPFDSDKWSDLKLHQPFYAQINFQETHRTFHAPAKADPAKVKFPKYYPDHPVTREDWAKYLDAASELDRKIGLILEQLEKDGLAGNTVVIFFGDHGQAHVRGKQFCYDEGLRVPLIVRWPDGAGRPASFKPGSVSDQIIEAIDFSASTLAIAGAKKPAKMQGRAFLGAHPEPARRYAFGARDRCDETVFRFRTVRDERYRYIRNFTPERPFLQHNDYKERQYPVWNLLKELDSQGKLDPVQTFLTAPTMPPEELYDTQADPDQVVNLVNSPSHQAVLKRLRTELENWIETSNDQGRVPEPAEVAAAEGRTKPAAPKENKPAKKAKKKK